MLSLLHRLYKTQSLLIGVNLDKRLWVLAFALAKFLMLGALVVVTKF